MRKTNWVSLPEVTEATEGIITVGHTGLPAGLDVEQIECNVTALEKGVINWGGYSSLVLAAYEGEADRYDVSGSPDRSGTGTATGAVSVSKAESSMNSSTSDAILNVRNIRNGTLGVQWNITALNGRIEAHEQYDPTIRARQLDRAIRREAIPGVFSHNMKDVLEDRFPVSKGLLALSDLMFFTGSVGGNLHSGNYSVAAGYTALWSVGMVTWVRLFQARMHEPPAKMKEMINDPLFFSFRPTRATIAAATLATSRLVRAR